MGNPVVHWELMSKEPAKVAGFYEKIFAWKIRHQPVEQSTSRSRLCPEWARSVYSPTRKGA